MSLRFWAIVIIIIAAFGIAITFNNNNKPSAAKIAAEKTGASPAPTVVASDIASVPTTTLDIIGQGTVQSFPKTISGASLTENNKPEIFYEGAEYCPYCATERWAMAVALARFGSFSNLKVTHSSSSDVYANTQTLSFYGTSYKSDYVAFTPVEMYSNIGTLDGGYTTLQTPTEAEKNLVKKYNSSEGIPFVDFGNRYMISGATYNPAILSGLSWEKIAGSLADPSNNVAQGVDGTANTFTAAICKLTNNQPGNVCDTVIQGLEAKL